MSSLIIATSSQKTMTSREIASEELTQSSLMKKVHYCPNSGELTRISSYYKSKIGSIAGSTMANGYRYIQIGKKNYRAHRIVWLYVYGHFPTSHIDHINGDRADNRIENLREASNSENMMNQGVSARNKSGYLGITWSQIRNRWCVGVKVLGKSKNVGRFLNLDDAISARDRAYIEYGFHENHGKRPAKFNLHEVVAA
jgi:hypothetical protein